MRVGLFAAVPLFLFLGLPAPCRANIFEDAIDAITDANVEIDIALFNDGYSAGLAAGYDGRGPSVWERISQTSAAYADGYRRGVTQGSAHRAAARAAGTAAGI